MNQWSLNTSCARVVQTRLFQNTKRFKSRVSCFLTPVWLPPYKWVGTKLRGTEKFVNCNLLSLHNVEVLHLPFSNAGICNLTERSLAYIAFVAPWISCDYLEDETAEWFPSFCYPLKHARTPMNMNYSRCNLWPARSSAEKYRNTVFYFPYCLTNFFSPFRFAFRSKIPMCRDQSEIIDIRQILHGLPWTYKIRAYGISRDIFILFDSDCP